MGLSNPHFPTNVWWLSWCSLLDESCSALGVKQRSQRSCRFIASMCFAQQEHGGHSKVCSTALSKTLSRNRQRNLPTHPQSTTTLPPESHQHIWRRSVDIDTSRVSPISLPRMTKLFNCLNRQLIHIAGNGMGSPLIILLNFKQARL